MSRLAGVVIGSFAFVMLAHATNAAASKAVYAIDNRSDDHIFGTRYLVRYESGGEDSLQLRIGRWSRIAPGGRGRRMSFTNLAVLARGSSDALLGGPPGISEPAPPASSRARRRPGAR